MTELDCNIFSLSIRMSSLTDTFPAYVQDILKYRPHDCFLENCRFYSFYFLFYFFWCLIIFMLPAVSTNIQDIDLLFHILILRSIGWIHIFLRTLFTENNFCYVYTIVKSKEVNIFSSMNNETVMIMISISIIT